MRILSTERLAVTSERDIVVARQTVRQRATVVGFSLVEQTKIVTAASELARNTVLYGGGGTLLIEHLEDDDRRGLRMTFEDQGPGIPDVELAMRDGYTTGKGLGLGLSGTKRLVSEFHLESVVGKGTRVVATRWR